MFLIIKSAPTAFDKHLNYLSSRYKTLSSTHSFRLNDNTNCNSLSYEAAIRIFTQNKTQLYKRKTTSKIWCVRRIRKKHTRLNRVRKPGYNKRNTCSIKARGVVAKGGESSFLQKFSHAIFWPLYATCEVIHYRRYSILIIR